MKFPSLSYNWKMYFLCSMIEQALGKIAEIKQEIGEKKGILILSTFLIISVCNI